MRTFDAILIVRFLLWRPAIATIAMLFILGTLEKALGLLEPSRAQDTVCIGAQSFDLNDQSDREKLLNDLASFGTTPRQVLQRPPCDLSGRQVSEDSLMKLFKR